jgi:hypothetical protein
MRIAQSVGEILRGHVTLELEPVLQAVADLDAGGDGDTGHLDASRAAASMEMQG